MMKTLSLFRYSRKQFLADKAQFKAHPSVNTAKPLISAFTNELIKLQNFADSAKNEASLNQPFKAVWSDSDKITDAVRDEFPSELDVNDATLDDMVEIANGRDATQVAQDLNDDPEEYTMPGLPKDLASQPNDIFVMPNGVDEVHHLDTDDVDEYVSDGLDAIHDFEHEVAEDK